MSDSVIEVGERSTTVEIDGRSVHVVLSGGQGPVGETGSQGPAGDVARADTRAALATVSATANMTRQLIESGREGLFVFDATDQSALVTADTAQGIVVPPTSDATGASGAWVRKFTGPLDVRWFGAVLDNVTDDSAAVQAAIDVSEALSSDLIYYNDGAYPILIPGFAYVASTTFTLADMAHIIVGDESFGRIGGGYRCGLRWSGDVNGIVHSSYLKLRNLFLYGPGDGTEGIGVTSNSRFEFDDCMFAMFGSHGQDIEASIAGNGGNANLWSARRCSYWRNGGNGLAIGLTDGADTNAGQAIDCDFSENGRWGVHASNFLGNKFTNCHADGNGKRTGYTPSMCSDGTRRYAIIVGQEANALTTAPSGTTANNAVWHYVAAGANDGTRIPLYSDAVTAGTTFATGGSFHSDDGNAHNVFDTCYHEAGQGWAQLVTPSMVIGGDLCKYVLSTSTAAVIKAGLAGYLETPLMKVTTQFQASGATSVFGSTTGSNLAVTFDNGSATNTLTFRSTSGTTQTDGAILTSRNAGMFLRGYGAAGAQGNVTLQSGTTAVANSKSTGFNVKSGMTYQVNDVQISSANLSDGASLLKTASIDTDVNLAADSDSVVPSQKAVKAYVDASVGSSRGALVTKAADQTVANYTSSTSIAFDSEAYDDEDIHSKASTVTITIASPGVVTWNSHGLIEGTPIVFTTTGALPTGLVAGTIYFIVSPLADTFSVAATIGGAAINTSGSQSGTHTATTGNTSMIVPAGVTRVKLLGHALLASNSGWGRVAILKNGVGTAFPGIGYVYHSTPDGSNWGIGVQTAVIPVTAGDFFQMSLVIVGDSSVTVLANYTWFSMEIVG